MYRILDRNIVGAPHLLSAKAPSGSERGGEVPGCARGKRLHAQKRGKSFTVCERSRDLGFARGASVVYRWRPESKAQHRYRTSRNRSAQLDGGAAAVAPPPLPSFGPIILVSWSSVSSGMHAPPRSLNLVSLQHARPSGVGWQRRSSICYVVTRRGLPTMQLEEGVPAMHTHTQARIKTDT